MHLPATATIPSWLGVGVGVGVGVVHVGNNANLSSTVKILGFGSTRCPSHGAAGSDDACRSLINPYRLVFRLSSPSASSFLPSFLWAPRNFRFLSLSYLPTLHSLALSDSFQLSLLSLAYCMYRSPLVRASPLAALP
ncbi:hypothetical protein B0H11DRAFT_2260838 [Mycena galericulata]|nr:hypothetical protein B0H11DRAFT_2260838 [Mycena galericulata]